MECATLPVPLDYSGASATTLNLNVSRLRADTNPGREAVIALAGGPGQAATPLVRSFYGVLKPGLANRDLIVYDQRGTGRSNPLRCTAAGLGTGAGAATCANQVGPARAFFRTVDSVEDIERIRIDGGYAKVWLYGVSYGTYVAEAYAAAHPATTGGLVLDSVVGPEGVDVFQDTTFAAVKRVLTELCAGGECTGIAADPVGDVRKLAAKLAKKPISGPVIGPDGRSYRATLGETGLFAILETGDLNPTLRAELPGSVRAALTGDPKPILRLSARAAGLSNLSMQPRQANPDASSDALFLVTTCEETTIPWTRGAGKDQHRTEILNAVRAGNFDPFSFAPALSQIPTFCLTYPPASPAAAAPLTLPQVPTLILDGRADLRTPIEDAAAVQAKIPGSQLVTVPHTGHSVLSTEFTDCGDRAVAAFFAGQAAQQCGETEDWYHPTPRPPLSISKVVPLKGTSGLPGRTFRAILATVDDARRQIAGDAIAYHTAPKRVGGLRGGYISVSSPTKSTLHGYQYVPGVAVSGIFNRNGTSRFTVGGAKAAKGKITISKTGRVSGKLGNKRFSGSFARSAGAGTGLNAWAALQAWPSLTKALDHLPIVTR